MPRTSTASGASGRVEQAIRHAPARQRVSHPETSRNPAKSATCRPLATDRSRQPEHPVDLRIVDLAVHAAGHFAIGPVTELEPLAATLAIIFVDVQDPAADVAGLHGKRRRQRPLPGRRATCEGRCKCCSGGRGAEDQGATIECAHEPTSMYLNPTKMLGARSPVKDNPYNVAIEVEQRR